MSTENHHKKQQDRQQFDSDPDRWLAALIGLITMTITGLIAAGVTILVTLLVLVGGVWLMHQVLPPTVFTILMVVLAVDIVLGLLIRAFVRRRVRHQE